MNALSNNKNTVFYALSVKYIWVKLFISVLTHRVIFEHKVCNNNFKKVKIYKARCVYFNNNNNNVYVCEVRNV